MTARDGKNNARKEDIRALQKANPSLTYLEAGKLLDRLPALTAAYEKWRVQLGVGAEDSPVWLDMQLLDGSDIALVECGAGTYDIGYVILKMLGDQWKSRGARVIAADVSDHAWKAGFEKVSLADIPALIDELEASIDPFKDITDSLDGPQTVLLMTSEAIGEFNSIRSENRWRLEGTDLRRLRGRKVRIAMLVPDYELTHNKTGFFRFLGMDWHYAESARIKLLDVSYPSDKEIPYLKGHLIPIVGSSTDFLLPLTRELLPPREGGKTIRLSLSGLIGTHLGQTMSNVTDLQKRTFPGDIVRVVEADSLRFRMEGRQDPFRLELIHALASLKDRSTVFEVSDGSFVPMINDIYPEIEANGIRLTVQPPKNQERSI